MTANGSSPAPFGRMPENQELRELVAARCNGTATAQQWERLSELLVSDPAALEFYVAHLSMHAALSRVTADYSNREESASIMEGENVRVSSPGRLVGFFSRRVRVRSSFASARYLIWSLPLFLLVALAAVSLNTRETPHLFPEGGTQAWVLEVDGQPSLRTLSSGDEFKQASGTSDLLFGNGVQLKLSGEAALEILSATEVRLKSGQLHADVGPNGKGFRVLTETADVIDLGTVFGIQANSAGETDVIVFEGEVAYRAPDDSSGKSGQSDPSLLQGEAVRVQRDGTQSRIQTIWQDPVSKKWSTERPPEVDSPIVAVYDRLSGESSNKYYVVVPRGFNEDAKVYADRNYEWNSLKGSELPYELVGADYIRTFNDDKYNQVLEIQLELNCASIVYVLWDPRHLPPEWLRSEFEPTGQRLGMDLGTKVGESESSVPPPGVEADRFLGIGPGVSVDIPFVVWRKVVPDPGKVILGPNGDKSPALLKSKLRSPGSMYGIVVRPLRSAFSETEKLMPP